MVTAGRGGTVFAYSSRAPENKGVTRISFKPVGACEQLLLELGLGSVYAFIIDLKCDEYSVLLWGLKLATGGKGWVRTPAKDS